MEKERIEKRTVKKTFTIIALILTLILCTTGATYAYFAIIAENSTAITGNTATAGIDLAITPAPLKTGNTGVMVPQKYSTLATAINNTNKCVDGNNNIVCKIYTITITNKGSSEVRVNGTIAFTGNLIENNNLKWKRLATTTTLATDTTNSYVTEGVTAIAKGSYDGTDLIKGSSCKIVTGTASERCTQISLGAAGTSSASTSYVIAVWLEETGAAQNDTGKSFTATVHFEGENGTGVTSTFA